MRGKLQCCGVSGRDGLPVEWAGRQRGPVGTVTVNCRLAARPSGSAAATARVALPLAMAVTDRW